MGEEKGVFYSLILSALTLRLAGAPVAAAPGRQPLTMAPGLMGLRQHSFLPICWVHGVGQLWVLHSITDSESVSCSGTSDSSNTMGCSLQDPLSMKFSRQEYWSELPFPSPGDLSNPRIESRSPALQADSLPTEPL